VVRYVRDIVASGTIGEVISTTLVASPGAWGATVEPRMIYGLDRANGVSMLTIQFGHAIDALCWHEEGFLGHDSIATTRLYAETTAATLQRRFDRLTDPAAHALVSGIRQQRGDEAALLAADLLAQRRAERLKVPPA
jgi:predicted dehydrogenase